VTLTINGGPSSGGQTISLPTLAGLANTEPTGSLPYDQITSLSLSGNLGSSSPVTVTVGGGPQEQIGPGIFIEPYNGAALDSLAGCPSNSTGCEFDVLANVVPAVSAPEPSIVALFGVSLWFLRRRRAQA